MLSVAADLAVARPERFAGAGEVPALAQNDGSPILNFLFAARSLPRPD
jgi:hypothetical protein